MGAGVTKFNLSLENALDEEASQGICTKWKKTVNVNGKKKCIWIKAGSRLWGGYMHDCIGEIVASQVAEDLGIRDVVKYRPCILKFKNELGTEISTIGCYSYDFTRENEEVVNIDDLSKGEIAHIGYFDLIQYVNEETGIEKDEFRDYLDRALLLDSIILNVDRRLGNIAVIKNKVTGKYRICPIFDNGQSFGLQNNIWETDGVYEDACVCNFTCKPFCSMHDEQLRYTHYYLHEEGQKELDEMLNRSIDKTIRLVYKIYEYFGFEEDSKWSAEKVMQVQSIREKVNEPIMLTERDYIISQLKRRIEIAVGREESTFQLNY